MKKWKRKISQKQTEKQCLGGCEQNKFFFAKAAAFEKWANTILCSEGKRAHIFVDTIWIWRMALFLQPHKITKHYKNWGFSRHKGKPKMALLVAKVPFWEGASKGGFYYLWYTKLCSAENTVFIVFSAIHSFAEIKECKLKNRNWPKMEVVCQHAKRCFFWGGAGGLLFFRCFLFFCFAKRPKKAIFLQFQRALLFQKACL